MNRLHLCVNALFSVCILQSNAAFADPPELATALSSLRAAHPRLLWTADEEKRVAELAETEALLARLIEQNRVNAARMLNEPSVRYEIPDGKRLLAQSRKCIERVVAMAMAGRLSGERRFVDGAVREMLVAAKFKDWNPGHFLDTAEMTAALAIGYDWLYSSIPPDDRRTIRTAIVELGLKEGMVVYRSGKGWPARDNNWNQVCNGGMVLGALAVAEEHPELAAEVVRYAVASAPHGLGVYRPSGAYPEGPSYWEYGTSYTCLTIAALRSALGDDFGLHETPGLSRTGWFRIHTIGPTSMYFNYADGGTGSRPAAAMFFLSRAFDEPAWAWWHRRRLSGLVAEGREVRPSRQDRFFPLEIVWYDPRGAAPTPQELPRDAFFESQQDVVTMRGDCDDRNAAFVGFKAGDNRANHGHLDIGSFVYDAAGVRWAVDLGADDYNLPGYFGRQRWRYYRLTNHSHNTLVIDGRDQEHDARADVIAYHSDAGRAACVVDMTRAYRSAARSVRRGVELVERRAIHVRDEIAGATGPIRWAMVTAASVDASGATAVLSQDGKQLRAEILSPSDARFEVLPNRPATSKENQNEGTSLLAIRVEPKDNADVVLSALLQPIVADKPLVAIEDVSLERWPNSLNRREP